MSFGLNSALWFLRMIAMTVTAVIVVTAMMTTTTTTPPTIAPVLSAGIDGGVLSGPTGTEID